MHLGPAGAGSRRHSVVRLSAALAILLAFVGFLVVTQIRNEWRIRRALRLPSTRLEELAFELRDQERGRAALEKQISEMRARLAEYEAAAAEGRAAAARMNRELQETRTLVGLTALEGPGIAIELSDSQKPLRPGDDPNKNILHYTDIAAVVADLWAAGAEAVAVNGERIVSSTGISCVGTTILSNVKRMAPPYLLVAIGDRKMLLREMKQPGGTVEQLVAFGFPAKLTQRDRVEIPAYRGAFRFDHAVVGGDKAKER